MYARLPEELPRQFAAMRAHPELVRGDGDLDTELMRALPGVVAKGGAEALASVGDRGRAASASRSASRTAATAPSTRC